MSAFFDEKNEDSVSPPSVAGASSSLPEAFYGLEAVITSARRMERELGEERGRIAALEEAHRAEKKGLQAQLLELRDKANRFGLQLEGLKSERASERNSFARLESENKSLRELLNQLQLEQARTSRESAEERRKHETALSESTQERRQMADELSALKRDRQRLESEVARLESELARLREERARADAEASRCNLERQKLQSEALEARANAKAGAQAIERQQGTVRELENALRKYQERMESQELQNQELSRRLQVALMEYESSKSRLAAEKENLKEAETKFHGVRKEWLEKVKEESERVQRLRRELAETESLNRALEENVRSLNERLEWAESEGPAGNLKETIDRLEIEVRRLSSQLDSERKQAERYQKENSELIKYCEKVRVAARDTETKLIAMESELGAAMRRRRPLSAGPEGKP